jgi:hypothetical protein
VGTRQLTTGTERRTERGRSQEVESERDVKMRERGQDERVRDPDLSLFTTWRADIFGVAGLLPYSLELIGFRRRKERKKAPVLVEAFRSLFTITAMPLPLRGLVALRGRGRQVSELENLLSQ